MSKHTEIIVNDDFIKEMDKYRQPDKNKGLIANCKDSVVLFAEYMLGIKLYAWQVKFLITIQQRMEDKSSREFIALTSRQIGKSTALAIFSTWATIFNKYPGTVSNNTLIGIASASDVQAKKLLYEMKKLIRLGDRHMEYTYKDAQGEPVYKDLFTNLIDEHEPNNTTTITWKAWEEHHGEFLAGSKSGSVIKSYPPTSAVLGETFSVVLIDEAGKTDKITDQFFYDYMYPTGNSTNAIRVYTSTPWVSSGFFYRLVDPDDMYPDSDADVFIFTIQAIELENPGYHEIVMKTVKSLQADGKNDEVQRAYYCRFVKGEQSYFDSEKVFPAFIPEMAKFEQYSKSCDMGIDFGGQVKSRTVITISALDDNGYVDRLYHRAYVVGEDLTLLEDVAELMTRFNIERIIPDDCPAGTFLIRQMKEKGWNVHPMGFRTDKVKKYGAFRSKLNRGQIRSYKDEELQTEMLAMEFSNSSRQSIIQHAPGYSDDLIDSFVMSCYFFLDEDDGIKFFDYSGGSDTQYKVGCQQCGNKDIIGNECKSCGWIQR